MRNTYLEVIYLSICVSCEIEAYVELSMLDAPLLHSDNKRALSRLGHLFVPFCSPFVVSAAGTGVMSSTPIRVPSGVQYTARLSLVCARARCIVYCPSPRLSFSTDVRRLSSRAPLLGRAPTLKSILLCGNGGPCLLCFCRRVWVLLRSLGASP